MSERLTFSIACASFLAITSGAYVVTSGIIDTFASGFSSNAGMDADTAGYVYIADGSNNRIVKTDGSQLTTYSVGGNGVPQDVAVDSSGTVYVAYSNGLLNILSCCGVSTTLTVTNGAKLVAVDGSGNVYYSPDFTGGVYKTDSSLSSVGTQISALNPISMWANSDYLYLCVGAQVQRMDLTSYAVTHIAGTGFSGHTGDGGPAVDANLGFIASITGDTLGNIYYSAEDDYTVRYINSAGIINAFAGMSNQGGPSGDGGPALSAKLMANYNLACANGVVYISSEYAGAVRKVPYTVSLAPTAAPTDAPTSVSPTVAPTAAPSVSEAPSVTPTTVPTVAPSVSEAPSQQPTLAPSRTPTTTPTWHPTVVPTLAPSMTPTVAPTVGPTVEPSLAPTYRPTPKAKPTSTHPTRTPTTRPTLVGTKTITFDLTVGINSINTGLRKKQRLLSSISLESATEDAIEAAVAAVLGLDASQVTFSSYSVTGLTSVSATVSVKAFTGEDQSQTELYASLTTSFAAAVSGGDFTSALQTQASAYSATQLTDAGATSSSASDLSTGNTNHSDRWGDGLIAGTVVVGSIGLILLAVVVYFYCRTRSAGEPRTVNYSSV